MDYDQVRLTEQLHEIVAHGGHCTVKIREGERERRIKGMISAVSAESIVLHETGNSNIDVYPVASIIAIAADGVRHAQT